MPFVISLDSSTEMTVARHAYSNTSVDPTANLTLMSFSSYRVALWLNIYSTPIIATIAFVCNTATFVTIVYLKPVTTSSIFVAMLAVADTTSILLKLIYLEMTNADVHMGDLGCGFLDCIGSMFVQYSNWIVVLMTSERFVAIWFPFRVSETITTKRVVWSLVGLAILFFVINSQKIFMSIETYDPISKVGCGIHPHYEWYITYVWSWLNTLIYALIPCIFLAVLNALIIMRLKQAFKEQRNLSTSDTTESNRQSQLQLTGMLVVVSLCLVLMLTPVCVYHLIVAHLDMANLTLTEKASYVLFEQTTFCIANLSHAINFVFYFLSSRKFRRVFAQLLRCQSRRTPPYSVSRAGTPRTSINLGTTRFLINTTQHQNSPLQAVRALALKDFSKCSKLTTH